MREPSLRGGLCFSYNSSISEALADVAQLFIGEKLVLAFDQVTKFVPRQDLK